MIGDQPPSQEKRDMEKAVNRTDRQLGAVTWILIVIVLLIVAFFFGRASIDVPPDVPDGRIDNETVQQVDRELRETAAEAKETVKKVAEDAGEVVGEHLEDAGEAIEDSGEEMQDGADG